MIQYVNLAQPDNFSYSEENKRPLYEIGRIKNCKVFYSPVLNRVYKLDENDLEDIKMGNPELIESKSCAPAGIIRRQEGSKKAKIIIFLTTACNLRCVYCYGFGGDKPSSIDFNFIKAQIDENVNSHTKELNILFHGTGEPTLAFDLIKKTVKYARSKINNVNFQIQSNGVMNENVLNWLIENKFDFVISCDGPPEIQDKQRPSLNAGKSDLVEKTIKKLIENNCLSVIRGTVTDYSSKKMMETLEYFHSFGVPSIKLEPAFSLGRASQSQSAYSKMENFDIYEENLLKICELAEEYGMELQKNYIPLIGVNKNFCNLPHRVLTTDNHVVSCVDYTYGKENPKEFSYGDYDSKKNKIIINREKLRSLQEISVERISACSDCFLKSSCAGWCSIINYHETGSALKPNMDRCKILRSATKKYLLYKVEKHLIQIKPYIYKRDKKIFFSMFFNEFEMQQTNGKRLKGNPLIRINLGKMNLNDLAKKIIAHKKSRVYKPTLFLLSFRFQEKDLDAKNGKIIISFLDKLKENRIFYKVTRPLLFCVMPKDVNIKNYDLPKSCKECLELFIVKKDGHFDFCTKKSGCKNLAKYSDRVEMFNEFKTGHDAKFLNKCMNCINVIRGNCQGVCCQQTSNKN